MSDLKVGPRNEFEIGDRVKVVENFDNAEWDQFLGLTGTVLSTEDDFYEDAPIRVVLDREDPHEDVEELCCHPDELELLYRPQEAEEEEGTPFARVDQLNQLNAWFASLGTDDEDDEEVHGVPCPACAHLRATSLEYALALLGDHHTTEPSTSEALALDVVDAARVFEGYLRGE